MPETFSLVKFLNKIIVLYEWCSATCELQASETALPVELPFWHSCVCQSNFILNNFVFSFFVASSLSVYVTLLWNFFFQILSYRVYGRCFLIFRLNRQRNVY